MAFTDVDFQYLATQPKAIADKLNASLVKVESLAGANIAGKVTLAEVPAVGVVAVFAFTTATGAVATKALLALTTDFTVSGKELTMVTDQSANTLVVIYK